MRTIELFIHLKRKHWLAKAPCVLALAAVSLFLALGGCSVREKIPCATSQACAVSGLCSTSPEGKCIATKEEDCRASLVCRNGRYCIPIDNECAPVSEGYCYDHPKCKSEGLCHADRGKARCIAQTNNDCEQSEACKSAGRCMARGDVCISPTESVAGEIVPTQEASLERFVPEKEQSPQEQPQPEPRKERKPEPLPESPFDSSDAGASIEQEVDRSSSEERDKEEASLE